MVPAGGPCAESRSGIFIGGRAALLEQHAQWRIRLRHRGSFRRCTESPSPSWCRPHAVRWARPCHAGGSRRLQRRPPAGRLDAGDRVVSNQRRLHRRDGARHSRLTIYTSDPSPLGWGQWHSHRHRRVEAWLRGKQYRYQGRPGQGRPTRRCRHSLYCNSLFGRGAKAMYRAIDHLPSS